jgi:oxalate decarboxylase
VVYAGLEAWTHAGFAAVDADHLRGAFEFLGVAERVAACCEVALRLGGNGMREPHWHPETAEMGYVLTGRSRMTIKSPGDGPSSLDTFEIGPGDMYFIPKGYPHHIENLGTDELHFLIFFDRAMPEDIGYTGSIPAFPRRMVAPTLGTTERALPHYPELSADAMIVKKRNPVES